jgi:hypothetical protein
MKVTYGAIVQRASGRFGGTVHSNWKGVDVVRRFAQPSNPETTSQNNVRHAFANLTRSFQLLPIQLSDPWTNYARGKKFLARNAWLGLNVPLVSGGSSAVNMMPYPGDSGAVPPTEVTAVGGSGTITGTVTIPTAPTGWTIASAILIAVGEGDFRTPLPYADCKLYGATDSSSPFNTPVITGLPAGTYYVWGMAGYTKPDGTDAYSAAIADTGVTETVT